MRLFLFPSFRSVAIAACIAAGTLGCDRPPSADGAREWTPQDHDHADERNRVLSGGSAGPRAAKGDGGSDDSVVVEITWQRQCASCHGREGRGDGPQGPMVKAPDLTSPDWQGRTSDEAIAAVIAGGKGMMPKFDLPADVVAGLVARIRAANANARAQARQPSESPTPTAKSPDASP